MITYPVTLLNGGRLNAVIEVQRDCVSLNVVVGGFR
jgi:hypothetical protein